MKRKDVYAILVLLLIFTLVIVGYVSNAEKLGMDNLVSYDSWYHYKITLFTLDEGKIIKEIPHSASSTDVIYTTLLPSFSAVLSLITGLTPFSIYRFSGVFVLLLLGFFIYLITKRVTNKPFFSFFGVTLLFSASYLFTRMTMNLPENYAFLFFGAILFFLSIDEITNPGLFILLTGYVFFHYLSLAVLVLFLVIFAIFNRQKIFLLIKNKKFLLIFVAFLIICLPIFFQLGQSYLYLAKQYLGVVPAAKELAVVNSVYNPLSLQGFIGQTNYLFLLIGIIGIIYVVRKGNKTPFIYAVLLTLLVLLIAMFSPFLVENIPTYRFLGFAVIFLSLFGAIGLSGVGKQKTALILFGLIVLLFMVNNIFTPHGWLGIKPVDKEAIKFINLNYPGNVKISYGSPYYAFVDNAEWAPLAPLNQFHARSRQEVLQSLKKYQSNKSILLIVSYDGTGLLVMRNPSFFEFMSEYAVYDKGGVKIYEINSSEVGL